MAGNEFVDGDELDPFDPNTEAVKTTQVAAKRKSDEKLLRNIMETRKGAYYRVFVEGSPSREDREIVLNDLHAFCRHKQTTYHDNARVHVLLTGRQEVTLRIDDYTRLSVDELVLKHTGE